MVEYSSLQERLFWPFSFSHSVKMPSCQGTLYQCLRLPTIFFQIIQTSKQEPINQPSEPCSFQLLRTLFLQCFGSQQSKAKPGPHFVHASCYDMCIQVSFKIIIIDPNLKNEFTQFTYGTGEEFLEYLAAEDGVRCKTLEKSGFNLLFVIPCHGLMIQEK